MLEAGGLRLDTGGQHPWKGTQEADHQGASHSC